MHYLFLDHETCGPTRIPLHAERCRALLAEANPADTASLVTCHRVEVATTSDALAGQLEQRFVGLVGRADGLGAAERRWAEIACGLRSLLLGELEIFRQVQQAVASIHRDHPFLPRATRAVAAALAVRKAIGFGSAIDYADITAAVVGSPRPPLVYVWGAGALGRELATSWRARGAEVTIVSRSAKRARRRIATDGIAVVSPSALAPEPRQRALCLLATRDTDNDYVARLERWLASAPVDVCIDLCGPPLFPDGLRAPTEYVCMHDPEFQAHVARSNIASARLAALARAALDVEIAGGESHSANATDAATLSVGDR